MHTYASQILSKLFYAYQKLLKPLYDYNQTKNAVIFILSVNKLFL